MDTSKNELSKELQAIFDSIAKNLQDMLLAIFDEARSIMNEEGIKKVPTVQTKPKAIETYENLGYSRAEALEAFTQITKILEEDETGIDLTVCLV